MGLAGAGRGSGAGVRPLPSEEPGQEPPFVNEPPDPRADLASAHSHSFRCQPVGPLYLGSELNLSGSAAAERLLVFDEPFAIGIGHR